MMKDIKRQSLKALKYLQDLDKDDVLEALGLEERTSAWATTFGTLGIFALPELAELAVSRKRIAGDNAPKINLSSQWQGVRDVAENWWLVLRCSVLGTGLGAIPGIGSAVIDWIAYGYAQRTEKNAETFGTGDVRGVIAPESSNNAKEGGHLVPTIAFGVPAGASMAILLGAFLMHGLTPGPEMLTKHLDLTYMIVWSLTLAHVIGAIICLACSSWLAQISRIRPEILLPVIIALVFVAAFEGEHDWGDLYTLVFFGVIGWIMKRLGWPRPPMVLGLVVGVVCLFFCTVVKNALGYDDSLDVFGVHCVGGIVGALGTGILVNPALGGTGIMDYTTGKIADYDFTAQMISQIWGVCTTLVWSGIGSAILYKVVDVIVGLRANVETEREGLDITEHTERAYNM